MSGKAMSEKAKGKQKQAAAPSANWMALQKTISKRAKGSAVPVKKSIVKHSHVPTKMGESSRQTTDADLESNFPRGSKDDATLVDEKFDNSESSLKAELRKMIRGEMNYSVEQMQPGKYLALDCEMVGVGPHGSESSLARVSLVNYNGAIVMDEFVRQRERVTDYRTFVSGIRPGDLLHAKPFRDVQQTVSELLKERILVGHAVHNDLKSLLLSHPHHSTLDTQICAGKARILKTKFPSLKKLVEHEVGVAIQRGEHSSVTDARATMALYRLHKKEWDKNFLHGLGQTFKGKKRKQDSISSDASYQGTANKKLKVEEIFPGGGRRGVSSGLSTVVKQRSSSAKSSIAANGAEGGEGDWWSTLGGIASRTGSKGTLKM